jgi:hypothetical protein
MELRVRLAKKLLNCFVFNLFSINYFRYPFDPSLTELYDPLHDHPLKAHQKVNHFPGIGALADKSFLSTRHRDLKYILPGFGALQKDEFRDYVTKNPKRKFVQKFIQNRGVKIVDKSEIDFNVNYKFYQAFMDNPMLIDGRAFDMGVYGNSWNLMMVLL